MIAVIAVNNLGFIGKDNKLMWHSSADLQHFKALTKGRIMHVGHRTYLTLPNVVKMRDIIRDTRDEIGDPITLTNFVSDLEETREIICIGGKKTYEKYCGLFTELHISHINDNQIGDCLFPDLSRLNPECKIFNYHFEVNQ